MAKLIVRNALGEDREFPLTDRDLRIGRGEQNDVVLPDPEKAVSRFHAELRFENGSYVLVDASSPNGIWVDGRRMPEVTLRPGVEAVIGPYTLTLDHATVVSETMAVSVPPTVLSTAMSETPRPVTIVKGAPTSTNPLPTVSKPPARAKKSPNVVWIGAVAALLVISVVIVTVAMHRRAARINEEKRQAELAHVAPVPLPPPIVSRDEQVRQHVGEAQRLLDSGQFDDAKIEVAKALELDPANADAMELSTKIEAALKPPPLPPVPSQSKPPVSPPPAVGPSAIDPKLKSQQERFEQGKQALGREDYVMAISIFEALLREAPGNRDVPPLLDTTRAKLREQIASLLASAKKAEDAWELPTALRLYGDAQKSGASTTEDQSRVRAKMLKQGTEDLAQGKTLYAFGQLEKALSYYERAYQYLRDDDPNRKVAKERRDDIRARLKLPPADK